MITLRGDELIIANEKIIDANKLMAITLNRLTEIYKILDNSINDLDTRVLKLENHVA